MSKAAVQPQPTVLAKGQNSKGTFWAMVSSFIKDKETGRNIEKAQFLGSLEPWDDLTIGEELPKAYLKYLRK